MANEREFRLASVEDEQQFWMWDAHHCPRPLPPLVQDNFKYFARLGLGMIAQFVNGYLYLPVMNQHPGAELPPSPHADARTSWEQHFLPLVQEQLRIIRSIDLSLPADVLAATIPVAAERAAYGFASTMAVVGQVSEKLRPLVGFLEKAFPTDGALRAMTLVGGYANETAQLGVAIQKLADIAREAPVVVQALQATGSQSMEGVPACGPFLTALAAFIEDYGDSALTWFETHGVTWREDPAPVYQLVAAALKDSRVPAGASAAERREKMLVECLSLLSGSEQHCCKRLPAGRWRSQGACAARFSPSVTALSKTGCSRHQGTSSTCICPNSPMPQLAPFYLATSLSNAWRIWSAGRTWYRRPAWAYPWTASSFAATR